MRRVIPSAVSDRPVHSRRPVFWILVGLLYALAAPGCHEAAKSRYTTVGKPQTVRLVQPQVRDIVRVVGQPSFTQSYERSSVYPKMNAYILKWIVDIGDRVKKDDVLATLFVPELVVDHGTKKATVVLDRERIALANAVVEVAAANVEAAEARLEEARADLASYRAEAERWESETKRLDNELKRGVVNPQDVLQTTNRWKACVAMRDTAAATVQKADAELLSRRAALSKAKVDVRVAEADADRGRERGKETPGLGGLPRTARTVRRRDRGPQRKYLRFCPAHHGRPFGLPPRTVPLAGRRGRADLRG